MIELTSVCIIYFQPEESIVANAAAPFTPCLVPQVAKFFLWSLNLRVYATIHSQPS